MYILGLKVNIIQELRTEDIESKKYFFMGEGDYFINLFIFIFFLFLFYEYFLFIYLFIYLFSYFLFSYFLFFYFLSVSGSFFCMKLGILIG